MKEKDNDVTSQQQPSTPVVSLTASFGNSVEQIKDAYDWEGLEEQYFIECLEDGGGGIFTYKLSPIKLFEWFKSKIQPI